MPNVSHDIMWCSQAWIDMNAQIIQNNWRISENLLVDCIADLTKRLDDEREKSRMK